MGAILFILVLFFCVFVYLARKYANPYKLTFIFGKKGAGKSCYMVKKMLQYQKRGWTIYTDMADIRIPGVRIISQFDLASFAPVPHSALFLDEVGITMDNRQYKSFPPGMRDFFKYIRKMKLAVFMNSQSFDVDKKVRDTVDRMVLQISIGGFLSLSRPIHRSVTLTEPSAEAESRIADRLRFGSIFSWRLFYMPKYFKYFDSLAMPARQEIKYSLPVNPLSFTNSFGGVMSYVHEKFKILFAALRP